MRKKHFKLVSPNVFTRERFDIQDSAPQTTRRRRFIVRTTHNYKEYEISATGLTNPCCVLFWDPGGEGDVAVKPLPAPVVQYQAPKDESTKDSIGGTNMNALD